MHRAVTSVCQNEKATSTSSASKQDTQLLIRFCCMLRLCTSSPAAISAQGMQTIWHGENICCDERKEATSDASIEAAKREILYFCAFFFFFSVFQSDWGWNVPEQWSHHCVPDLQSHTSTTTTGRIQASSAFMLRVSRYAHIAQRSQ